MSLLGNPGCPDQLTNPTSTDEDDYERYRLYAIHTLPPTLRFLDSRRVTQQERLNAKDRGRYSRTIKLVPELVHKFVPNSTHTDNEFDDIYFNIHYTPLPNSLRAPQDHKGAYSQIRSFNYNCQSLFWKKIYIIRYAILRILICRIAEFFINLYFLVNVQILMINFIFARRVWQVQVSILWQEFGGQSIHLE